MPAADLDGSDVFGERGGDEKALRRRISLVFQDPFSYEPPHRAGAAIGEPLWVHRLAKGKRARPGGCGTARARGSSGGVRLAVSTELSADSVNG